MAYWYKCQCLFVYLIIIIQYTTGSIDTGINLTLLIFSSDYTFLSSFLYPVSKWLHGSTLFVYIRWLPLFVPPATV